MIEQRMIMENGKSHKVKKVPLVNRLAPFFYILPGVTVLAAFFLSPLVNTLKTSFHPYSRTQGMDTSVYVLDNYIKLLMDPYYLQILFRTLRISFIVTVICIIMGYAVGYYLANTNRRAQAVFILIYLAPWFVSIIVKAFGWTLLLAPNGYVNQILMALGLLDKPLRLMWSELGVIIGMVHIYLIFVVLSVFSCLVGQDPLLRRAAANLGATGWQTFKRVTLPLSLPGLLAGSVIVFTLTMSAFVTPAVLGGRRIQMIANMAFNQTVEMLNWPFGGAIALFLMLLTVAIVLGYQRLIVMGKWKVIFK